MSKTTYSYVFTNGGRSYILYIWIYHICTDEVNDHTAVAPPARRPAEVGHAVRRVGAGEHVELRRVAAEADVAGLGHGIAEAEQGIVFQWRGGRRSSAAAAAATTDRCDQQGSQEHKGATGAQEPHSSRDMLRSNKWRRRWRIYGRGRPCANQHNRELTKI